MAKSPARPYFNYGIKQLEDLYAQNSEDLALLQILAAELAYRGTDRAARLARQVHSALTIKQPTTLKPKRKPAETSPKPPAPKPVPQSPHNTSLTHGPVTASGIPSPVSIPVSPSRFQKTGIKNTPSAVIANWIAVEALAPQTFRRPEDLCGGVKSRIAGLRESVLPWQAGLKAPPNCRLFFQVVLGTLSMDAATTQLIQRYGEDEERSRPERSKAIIASILLDRNGIPVEDGIAVSSFAWALPRALAGQLDGLEVWPSVEAETCAKLSALFNREDEDGVPIAVDLALIDTGFEWLVSNFNLSSELVEAPSISLKVFHGFRSRQPPEPLLLNSFFLKDLSRVASLVRSQNTPPALSAYLGLTPPETRLNVKDSHDILEAVLAPQRFPLARWPSPGGHPLALLQQAAVNITRIELQKSEGLVAVNGPPGTGKTTLLRDIIAAQVLARAEAMAAFEDPNTAFSASGHKVRYGPAAYFQVYRLHDSLKGHEMVVASSNNKAVENISRELPARSAVGAPELSYFKSISDRLFAPETPEDDESSALHAPPLETWGLIAAVMGNASNRAVFQKAVWWDEDYALRLYLKAAAGQKVTKDIRDETTGEVIGQRLPAVVDIEKPPSPEQALRNWRNLRTRFLKEKADIEAQMVQLEKIRSLCLALPALRAAKARSAEKRDAARADLTKAQSASDECAHRREAAYLALQNRMEERQALLPIRPGFWSRLFNTQSWKQWRLSYQSALTSETTARQTLTETDLALKTALNKTETATQNHHQASLQYDRDSLALQNTQKTLNEYKKAHGYILIDEDFIDRSHEDRQKLSPWIPQELNQRRAALFGLSLKLHKAFIDACAQKMLHNISVLFSDANSIAKDAERKDLLVDLWATLFIVVPVISTTFASIDRMLGDLPAASLGWLLIDEAGQATPQAAVGALMRCQRAVIVGDPLQIEPVVSLPETLNSRLAEYFEVTRTRFIAPEASAQTLADQASRFVGTFQNDKGLREVGVPLLVHRRCQNPMFAISNAIAYDHQMVLATPQRPQTAVARSLGPSRWVDIPGQNSARWSPPEGDALIQALSILAKAGITSPDIFVITPFRIVAEELRRRVRQEGELMQALGASARDWAETRIGTIHTFQGREAETVFLVLGATGEAQSGARAWATQRPNILNVAVSRARETLYVIGSRTDWAGMGCARDLSNTLSPTTHSFYT